ncbi:hypothetical protein TNCV_4957211 [Trichonephila clavipes]|nr:hypothetical protein TNCV_4957211 [Trichonephila clavipes]
MNPRILLSPNAAILCVDCPIEVEMSFVAHHGHSMSMTVNNHSVQKTDLLMGSSRFLLKTPLGFYGAEKANSFPTNPEAKHGYAN